LQLKTSLENMVEKLGGKVKNESEFDSSITHVICPPQSRTVKTLAAVLTNRWLVNPKWVVDSLEAGIFLGEQAYGIRSTETPFKGKKFFLTESFIKENEKKESRVQNCKALIVVFGRGEIIKDFKKADYILKGSLDRAPYSVPSMDWEEFLEMIAGGGKLKK